MARPEGTGKSHISRALYHVGCRSLSSLEQLYNLVMAVPNCPPERCVGRIVWSIDANALPLQRWLHYSIMPTLGGQRERFPAVIVLYTKADVYLSK